MSRAPWPRVQVVATVWDGAGLNGQQVLWVLSNLLPHHHVYLSFSFALYTSLQEPLNWFTQVRIDLLLLFVSLLCPEKCSQNANLIISCPVETSSGVLLPL